MATTPLPPNKEKEMQKFTVRKTMIYFSNISKGLFSARLSREAPLHGSNRIRFENKSEKNQPCVQHNNLRSDHVSHFLCRGKENMRKRLRYAFASRVAM